MRISSFQFMVLTLLIFGFLGTLDLAYSQNTRSETFTYQNVSLRKVVDISNETLTSKAEEIEYSELTAFESDMVKDLGSQWAWPENTLEMIDSYSPFLFRTNKSRKIEEVKLILFVNEKGKVAGFDTLSKVDKGLEQRLDHMIRKLPDCKPVPGFSTYGFESFELTISQ